MGFSFIKKAAPWIGTLISAAVPGAAPFVNIASNLLSATGGARVAPTIQGVTDAVTGLMATPEGLAQLRQVDDQFGVQMKTLGVESAEHFEQIAADDRADARAREVQLRDWYPKLLASVVVIACIVGEGCYFRWGSPANAAPELIGRILGTLDSALMLVLAYYFGSSMGSDRKTELMAANGTAKS